MENPKAAPAGARELAGAVLLRCERAGQYSNLALDAALRRAGLPEHDRALATALVYGVLERRLTLDDWIDRLSSRPPERISLPVRTQLRLGLYQLAYLDRVPDHAAVSEAVRLAGRQAGGFVNALLREFIRRGRRLPPPDRAANPVRFLSVTYSVCPPLCRRLLEAFGEARTEALLAASFSHPGLTLRVNTLRASREELAARLEAAGLRALPTPRSRSGLYLPGGASPAALPGFAQGLFFVQDEASQLCVEALDARPGMRVLDSCACPGSKSFGAAIDMRDDGELVCCDLHASKLPLLVSGAARLGLHILRPMRRDAREPCPEWTGRFDRVLCDVPCSGYGVMAKKPELRYKDPAASAALPDIQLAILRRSAEFLSPGGRLVYSTCTVLPDENRGNIDRFLAAAPGWRLAGEIPLYPDTDRTDGFYIAVLERA